ncbi:MAG: hypothetical protein V1870_05660 [Candidatus Aenigmatarchaeota archaeon]
MNIEKRKAGKAVKYYLSHTIRIGDKFKKIRIYLGTDENVVNRNRHKAEILMKKRIENYKNISDPFKTVLSKSELSVLKTLEAKGMIKIKHLNEDEWKTFIESFVYNTNAIEVSTVTLN